MTPALSINLHYGVWRLSARSWTERLNYAWLPLFAFFSSFNPNNSGLMFLGVLAGAIYATAFQQEILSKPFSCCLPNHRAICRRILVIQGCILSFLMALPILWFPHQTFLEMSLHLICAFSTLLLLFAAYVLGVAKCLGKWSGISLLVIIGVCLLSFWLGFIQHAIFSYPIYTLLVDWALLFFFWHRFDVHVWARSVCGQSVLPAALRNRNGNEGYARAVPLAGYRRETKQDFFWRFVERVALKKMERQGNRQGVALMLWSSLYESASRRYASPALCFFLSLILLFCVGWIVPSSGVLHPLAVFAFLFLLLAWLANKSLPFYSPIILRSGRRNYFRYLLVRGCLCLALAFLTALSVAGLSHIFSAWLPPMSIKEHSWHPYFLSLNACAFVLALGPFLLWLNLLYNPCLVRARTFDSFWENPAKHTVAILAIVGCGAIYWLVWAQYSFATLLPWALVAMTAGMVVWLRTLRKRVRDDDLV
jgi:hypothetical protein